MVSVAIGIVLGVVKYSFYIKNKSKQNTEMMSLIQETLSSLEEVLRMLGNVNPVKISSEIKRRIEILIDKLSRYIQKRLNKNIFVKQFSLQTERVKTKTMINQLSLLLQEFQIVQLNDLLMRMDSNFEKLAEMMTLLSEVHQKAKNIDEGVRFIIRKFNSSDDLCHSFRKLESFIRQILKNYCTREGNQNEHDELVACVESYFRTLRMLKNTSIDFFSYFSKLRISRVDIDDFARRYLENVTLKNLFVNQRILPILENPERNNLKLFFLPLESGFTANDFTKGSLLEIEGNILRHNIKYAYVSRTDPVGKAELDPFKNLYVLTAIKAKIKIYYLINDSIKLCQDDEFVVQDSSSSHHFKVDRISMLHNTVDDDERTLDINAPLSAISGEMIITHDEEQKLFFHTIKEKNTQNNLLNELVFVDKQDFYLKPKSEKAINLEFVWLRINETKPLDLNTNIVLKVHDKNFQVVYKFI